MKALRLIAGPRARQHLHEHGLRQQDVEVMVGASGGPKWFALYGLDQYLFGEFFRDRTTPLHLIGSSAGAWRFACFAQQNPVAASERFAHAYRDIQVPAGANTEEVTTAVRGILDAAIPVATSADSAQQILNNPIIKLNLIVARARRLGASRHRGLQALSLGLAAGANVFHRNTLGAFFERVLFHSAFNDHTDKPPFYGVDDLPTRRVALSEHNLRDAVMASGSIPMVLNGVADIHGAGPGMYYDGGVTDYHFDIPFSEKGMVLYPHFYSTITPGWFDKALKWRRANVGSQNKKPTSNFDNVAIVCPSPEWVASLPFGKIPDRKDFAKLDTKTRIQYWSETMKRSVELADDFDRLVHGNGLQQALAL